MKSRIAMLSVLFCLASVADAWAAPPPRPAELKVIQESVGVWDAEIRVWNQGTDKPPISFTGVETNRAFGEYWLASDFVSEFMGQTMALHSIIGYDLDKQQLVGTVIDEGPYCAKMTGQYDATTGVTRWTTHAKTASGEPMVQKTTVTHETPSRRVLVLNVADSEGDGFRKFMEIVFTKRNSKPEPKSPGPAENEQ